ncbi:MAG TPA: hypothetical protein LFW20_03470 [Rickettsia endosymbiont of Omalisus fontisbellaquei]|nr:hypothetical protein [Rickettsia endosymbiont of Omalisus fontisbellaquei]
MFNFFSKNTASNNIPSEVVNNSTTYAGVKVSDATYNYFANATEHFAEATAAAASCAGYATLTAAHAAQTAMQGVLGLCAYKEFAGYLMTGHAFGFAVPTAVGEILGGIATTMVSHPTAFMVGFVTAAIAVSPENAIETVKDAACTVIKAAEFVYHDAAGILNAAAGIGHLVYDNLPSYSEVTPIDLAGSMEISWVDAVA